MNKELGVTLNIPSISTADYPTRLNTVVAGSDLPDIIAAAIFSTTMTNIGDFLNSACADLTPYLSGDAVKAYPNLANLPSTAWPQMVYNNKIMAVPVAAGGVRNSPLLLERSGDLEAAGHHVDQQPGRVHARLQAAEQPRHSLGPRREHAHQLAGDGLRCSE